MSFESVVTKVNRRGMLVTQLYQDKKSSWRAALTLTGRWEYIYGKGDTAEAALEDAYKDAKRIESVLERSIEQQQKSKGSSKRKRVRLS